MASIFKAHGVSSSFSGLDSVLVGGATGGASATFGGRASVWLTPRLALEFGVNAQTHSGLTTTSADAIESARAGFESGLQTVLANPGTNDFVKDLSSAAAALKVLPNVVLAPTVTATSSVQAGGGSVSGFGDVRFGFRAGSSFAPYVIVGVGFWDTTGAMPTASLTGDYAFQVVLPTATAGVHETDTVTVTWQEPARVLAIFGGGITHALTRRSGIRGEVRVMTGPSKETIELTAQPAFASGGPPAGLLLGSSVSSPGLTTVLLANSPSPAGFAAPRTLAGPAITSADLPIFTAHGWQTQAVFSVGYYLRF